MLELVTPPPDLLCATDWSKARRLAMGFGRAAASFYLECRPAEEPSRRLDVLVGVGRAERAAFAAWCRERGNAGLSRLTQGWLGSGALSRLSALWLEYDRVGNAGGDIVPSVSACLQPSYTGGSSARAGGESEVSLQLMVEVIETITGEALSAHEWQRLDRCRSNLPRGGHFIHLSVMLGRRGRPLKLYTMVPRDGLLDLLSGVGWRGPLSSIDDVLNRYCPATRVGSELYVDLTVSDIDSAEGGNLVGLSFAPQHLASAREREPGRGPLLEQCVRAGLCSPERAQHLRRWPKCWLLERPSGDQHAARLVEQWLDLKLVFSPDAPLELKAYLGLRTRAATFADRFAFASAAP